MGSYILVIEKYCLCYRTDTANTAILGALIITNKYLYDPL